MPTESTLKIILQDQGGGAPGGGGGSRSGSGGSQSGGSGPSGGDLPPSPGGRNSEAVQRRHPSSGEAGQSLRAVLGALPDRSQNAQLLRAVLRATEAIQKAKESREKTTSDDRRERTQKTESRRRERLSGDESQALKKRLLRTAKRVERRRIEREPDKNRRTQLTANLDSNVRLRRGKLFERAQQRILERRAAQRAEEAAEALGEQAKSTRESAAVVKRFNNAATAATGVSGGAWGMLGLAATAVVGILVARRLNAARQRNAEALDQQTEDLRRFSFALAGESARQRILDVQQEVGLARRLGGDLAERQGYQREIARDMREIRAALSQTILPSANELTRLGGLMVEIGKRITEFLTGVIKPFFDVVTYVLDKINDGVEWLVGKQQRDELSLPPEADILGIFGEKPDLRPDHFSEDETGPDPKKSVRLDHDRFRDALGAFR